MSDHSLEALLRPIFDAAWYLEQNPDVASAGMEPLAHYIAQGASEGRDPNPFFDGAWYLANHDDVASSGLNPLLHYLRYGAAELRNPHPRFDAIFYADEHPDAAVNVLLYHMAVGRRRGWVTEPIVEIADYLPSQRAPLALKNAVRVDVVVPVYRGLAQTRACLESVLDDTMRLPGDLIVIDDHSPEPALSAWLDELNARGAIRLIRNARNLGFVASANRGISAAGRNDVILLNSDTVVPHGWSRRLAAQALSSTRVGTVSPFSNNATICGWPAVQAGPMALGLDPVLVDRAAGEVNAGRSVEVPTTVGFCMYIRRLCLDDVGVFDAKAFGQGYGEEVDFCLRASQRGWRHILACDTFVYHEGSVSFGPGSSGLSSGLAKVMERYPNYMPQVERHVRRDPAGPSRFALTVGAMRATGLPIILMVSHSLGGGVRHHIDRLVARLAGQAHVLLLEGTSSGTVVSVPALPTHPRLSLPDERSVDLERFLRQTGVARVHVHHVLGLGDEARRVIQRLGVPFDATAHDWFTICPQVNLLPTLDGHYCREPAPGGCNRCIGHRPNHGARDILSWRAEHAWLLRDADRVLCPTEDVRERLMRYGLDPARAVFAPHDPVPRGPWVLKPRPIRRGRLRVALLGVLANQKGAPTAISVIDAADPASFQFHLIGYPEQTLSATTAERLRVSGRYVDAELPSKIAAVAPNVIWFPAQWPETYSYTLSAAIDSGLPIVASDIGAFPERLAGRPMTWLVTPDAPAATWLHAFEEARAESATGGDAGRKRARRPEPDFYADDYLRPLTITTPTHGANGLTVPMPSITTARRPTVVVIPERLPGGIISPCAYIRLLLPLDHPAIGEGFDVVMADADEALLRRADVIATHRYALPDVAAAEALIEHARKSGARLLYDLDDDLINIPRDHPEASVLRPRAGTVEALARAADILTVSTEGLRDALAAVRRDAVIVENGLDERLWLAGPHPRPPDDGTLRVLIMGTATHDADLAVIVPALKRLHEELDGRVRFDVIGMTASAALPPWLRRLYPTAVASQSYPGFIDWITNQPGWDVGIAPLANTAFNASKSTIKTLDYAALGLAVLGSDVPAYHGSLADAEQSDGRQAGGMLLPANTAAWVEAVGMMLRNPHLRRSLAAGAMERLVSDYTLGAQSKNRRALWRAIGTVRTQTAPKRRPARATT